MYTGKKKIKRPQFGIYVTTRDHAVLHTLARYGLAHETTLHRLHYPRVKDQKHVQQSLRRLVNHELIGRRFLPHIHTHNDEFVDFGLQGFRGALYFLTEDGAALTGSRYNPEAAHIKLAALTHRIAKNAVRACFELAVRASETETLATYLDEHDVDADGRSVMKFKLTLPARKGKRASSYTLIPDSCAVFAAPQTDRQDVFLIEYDTGSMSGTRWVEKVIAYAEMAKQVFQQWMQFQGAGYRVLVITKSQGGKRQIERQYNLARAIRSVFNKDSSRY